MSKAHVARLREYKRTTERPSLHRYIVDATESRLQHCCDSRAGRDIRGSVGFAGFGSVGILPRQGEKKRDRVSSVDRRPKLLGVEYLDKDPSGEYFPVRCPSTYSPSPHYLVKSFNPSQTLEHLDGLALRRAYARKLEREDPDRKRRKAAGLTRRGKRIIRDGIAILERKYGTRGLGFYTLTCPYDTQELIQEFNDKYTEIVRRYLQEVKREYERKGVKFSYVGVHEVQPSRLGRTGHECLHLHYIAPAFYARGKFVLDSARIRNIYLRVLEGVMSSAPDNSPRVGCELVRASASAYLAKYYSKGQSADGGASRSGATASLSSWYTVSRGVRNCVSAVRVGLTPSIANAVYRASNGDGEMADFSYIKPIFIEIGGILRHVGAIFQFNAEKTREIQDLNWRYVCHMV